MCVSLLYTDVDSQKLASVNLIVRNYHFSWEKICTALEEMDETKLAKQIRSKHCNEDTAHSESTSQDQSTSGKTLFHSDKNASRNVLIRFM